MKFICRKRQIFTFKSIILSLLIIASNYFFINMYIGFWTLIDYYVIGRPFFFEHINSYNWVIFYFIFVAPGVNASLHIFYKYSGIIAWRLLFWLSTTIIIFSVIFFVFVS